MKRDNRMASLMADHVIAMIKEKRALENAQLQSTKSEEQKEHPVKAALQKFFNDNPKAFGCEKPNAIKLMSALTGFDFNVIAESGNPYYEQYSVVTSLISHKRDWLDVSPGSVVLIGSANGRIFNPSTSGCINCKVHFTTSSNDARRATDEEYTAFMKVLETDEARKNLVTWMANNGIADCCFGLKLEA